MLILLVITFIFKFNSINYLPFIFILFFIWILGVGLGLNICKSLAIAMGGEIGFKSELNKGTTFYFTVADHRISNDNEKFLQSNPPVLQFSTVNQPMQDVSQNLSILRDECASTDLDPLNVI